MTIEKTTIDGIGYAMWDVHGTVDQVLAKSSTSVWGGGGGGYANAYGAQFNNVTINSETTHFKEVRINGDDGNAHTVTLGDNVRAFSGDRVTLAYMGPNDRGHVHGLHNHRENHWWTFNTNSIARPNFKSSIIRLVARFIADHPIISFIAFMALLTFVGSLGYREVYNIASRPRGWPPLLSVFVDNFWFYAISSGIAIGVCNAMTNSLRKRVNKAASAAIAAFTAKQVDPKTPATANVEQKAA